MEAEFISLRNNYMPKNIKAIFVLESPPAGHGYFYNPTGRVSEVLFRAFMKVVLDFTPTTKDEGLRRLADAGYVLVNPIYTPVNKLPDKEADRLILNNYQNFKKDLDGMIGNTKTPIILVKSNIFRLLEKPLIDDGFNVINNGLLIPFPLHYHINTFQERVRKLLQV
jgi:hypothetical protein